METYLSKIIKETKLPKELQGLKVKIKNDICYDKWIIKAGTTAVVKAYGGRGPSGLKDWITQDRLEDKDSFIVEFPIFEEIKITYKTDNGCVEEIKSLGYMDPLEPAWFSVKRDELIWPNEIVGA